MKHIAERVNKVVGTLLTFLMVVIVLDVTWQVLTRFVLKNPSSFTEELAGFLLIWIGLLGGGYAFYTRSHLGIDVLTYKLKGSKKRMVDTLVNSLVFLFAALVMVAGGVRLVILTFTLNQISPALGIKMGYVYLVIPLSGVLIMLYSVAFVLEAHKKEPGEKEHGVSVVDRIG